MINSQPYKNRVVDLNKKVQVYRNLNNGRLSVKQGKYVVCHCDEITLKQTSFLVNEKKRQQVLKEKQKNVHASVEGYITNDEMPGNFQEDVWYNPYKTDKFRTVHSNEEVIHRDVVYINKSGHIKTNPNLLK